MEMKFNEIPIPKELDQVVEKSLNQIYAQKKKKRLKNIVTGFGAAAAFLIFGIFICISNPALAAKIPVLGHIFERLQKDYGYSGDYTGVKKELTNDMSEKGTSVTSDGITVTLSEIYCNDQALYITLKIESEERIPELLGCFWCETEENYSFNSEEQSDVPIIDGKRIDDHTYIGILRFDLNDKNKYIAKEPPADANGNVIWDSENVDKYIKEVKIPDHFTLKLELFNMYSSLKHEEDREKAEKNMTKAEMNAFEEGTLIYHGPWKFTLDVSKNTKDTQIIKVNNTNKKGIGLEKVVKDRMEITVYDIYKKEESFLDYCPVVLDADGRLMEGGNGGNINTVAIQDRDISKIDVFLIDYYKWMDELKGEYWKKPDARTKDGGSYRELLLKECDYHKEIVFAK